MQYDLLLKGGHVIDPKNGVDAKRDVAIADGKIAAVDRDLGTSLASKAVDVSGFYVTPGLIDLHVHLYGFVAWTFPDEYALPNGVTTVVDAGGPATRASTISRPLSSTGRRFGCLRCSTSWALECSGRWSRT